MLCARFQPLRREVSLDHRVRILSVAEEAGLSVGRLTRLFKDAVGLTPKRYLRIQRFVRVLRRTRKGQPAPWACLAVECGYYDQAHLINEFHALAGVSPSVYLRDRGERSPTDVTVSW
jgi:AraC-like DNA-binding protein